MDFRSINMCGTFGIVTTVSYLTKFVVLRLLIQISCPSAYELSVWILLAVYRVPYLTMLVLRWLAG